MKSRRTRLRRLRGSQHGLGDEPLGLSDVVWAAHEAQRNEIYPVVDAEDEIVLVLCGQRGGADGNAGQVDTLVLGEHAAMHYLADHVGRAHLAYPQLDSTV